MAKAPASDSIMAADKMKPLLALSKREPVQAAIALTNDGEGLILLDKKARPRKVFSMLKASAAKAKINLNNSTVRFGRAEVDTEVDAGTVQFYINKDAPGMMRTKLIEVVKHIPYQKVEFHVDPSLEADESEGDGDEQDEDGVPGAPPTPLDPDAARHELSGLIGRIAQAAGDDADRKALLMKLATAANEDIKANDPTAIAAAIAALREALDISPGASSTTPPLAPPMTGTPSELDALKHELAQLIGRITTAAGDDVAARARLAELASGGNGAIKAGDVALATEAITRLREELDASGGHEAEDPRNTEPREGGDIAPPPVTGMAAWTTARANALGSLKSLEDAIRAMNDPEGDRAIILLRAIQANLTAEPATSAQVEELVRYVSTDDIIEEAEDPNAFGFKVELRTPLMAALEVLRGELAAAGRQAR